MKKIFALCLAFVLVLSLCACGTNSETPTDNPSTESTPSSSVSDTTSTNENTADVKVDYTAPTALSSDFMDYTFRLEGDLYTLPVPVSEFVNNGWELADDVNTISANSTKKLLGTLKKGELALAIEVKNFSSVEKDINDVMVVGVWITEFDVGKGVDFELSGGIKPGVSVDAFKAANDMSKFTEESLSTGGTEYSHFEPSNRAYLTFKEGKLVEVSAQKYTLNK